VGDNLNEVVFISVMHDPKGLLLKNLRLGLNVLKNYYKKGYIALSESTNIGLKEELEKAGYTVFTIEKKGVGYARRSILRLVKNTEHTYYHYCDLDRMITWCLTEPKELEKVKECIRNFDYLIIGRTKKAFNTHPEAWIETEKITNKIFSIEFGEQEDIDVTAGSCGFNKSSLLKILKRSSAPTTDAEWPMIIKKIEKGKVGSIKVDGLKYIRDINNSEFNKTPGEEWLTRLRLSYQISQTAVNTKNIF
jgi:hypothetical protein